VLYCLLEKVGVLFPQRAYGSLALALILLTLSPLAAENAPTPLWTKTYNGSSNGSDHGNDIAVDDFGNVYITGFVQETEGGSNVLVQKYDATGFRLWTSTYNSPAGLEDVGNGIAVDGQGNVYVAGFENRSDLNQGKNVWVRKYDTSGLILWTTTYNSPANSNDEGRDIAVNAAGDVYVVGFEDRPDLMEGDNLWIRKYDTNGNVLWTTIYNAFGLADQIGNGIAVDQSGNVYVTGSEATDPEDILVQKYDAGGEHLWTQKYSGPGNQSDVGYGIDVDFAGNVYVGGHETRDDIAEKKNIWVGKYDTAGNLQWIRRHATSKHDGVQEVAVDGSGDVFVIGYEGWWDGDIWIRKYTSNGDIHWTDTIDGPRKYRDRGLGVAVRGGQVHVVGFWSDRWVLQQGEDVWVQKYDIQKAVWDGGGEGDRASTEENWSENTKPLKGEAVFFGATSGKDCVWDISVKVGTFTVDEKYTGAISLEKDLEVSSFLQAGGSFHMKNATLSVKRVFDQSGGVFEPDTGKVVLAGDTPQCTYQFLNNSPDTSFYDFRVLVGTVTLVRPLKVGRRLVLDARLDTNGHDVSSNEILLLSGKSDLHVKKGSRVTAVGGSTQAVVLGGQGAKLNLDANAVLRLGPVNGIEMVLGPGSRFSAKPGSVVESLNPGSDYIAVEALGLLEIEGLTLRSLDRRGLQIHEGAVLDLFEGLRFENFENWEDAAKITILEGTREEVWKNLVFADNYGFNVNASLVPGGTISILDSSGPRAGALFEIDPNDRIVWLFNDSPVPAAVTDLTAAPGSANSHVTLRWTAPDNGIGGRVAAYEIRVSLEGPIDTLEKYKKAQIVSNPPAPLDPGMLQMFEVSDLATGVSHCFSVRALDTDGIFGGMSSSPCSPAKDSAPPVVVPFASAVMLEVNGVTMGFPSEPLFLASALEDLDPTTVSSVTVRVIKTRDNLGEDVNELVQAPIFYDINSRTIRLAAGYELELGMHYRLTYSTHIRDLSGNPMESPFIQEVRTRLSNKVRNVVREGPLTLDIPKGTLPDEAFVVLNARPHESSVIKNASQAGFGDGGVPDLSTIIAEANRKRGFGAEYETPIVLGEFALFDSAGVRISSVATPLTAVFSFAEKDGFISGTKIRVESLSVYHLDKSLRHWTRMPGAVSGPTGQTIQSQSKNFFVFGVFGAPATDLSQVELFPNPFRPNAGLPGHDAVKFRNLSSQAVIRIYTITGELVRELVETDGDGSLDWDGKNKSGENVESDVYLYVIKNDREKETGKIVIIR